MIKRMIKIGVLFAVFLIITGISAYFALSFFIKSEDSVVVPDLMGKEVVQVLEILSGLGLNTKVSGSEFSSQIPRNHVIFQEPEPGTVIKKGRDVQIVFSKGIQSIVTPALTRMPVQDVDLLLSENGLVLKSQSYMHSEDIPANTVIAQYPDQGTEIQQGTGVDLLVSLGRKPVEYMMGDLKGMAVDDAVFSIEQNRMKVGDIKNTLSEEAQPDAVIAQYPPPGSMIREGSSITLTINREEDPEGTYPSDAGPRIFTYQTEYGFINKHVRVKMTSRSKSQDIYNEYVKPGEEVWLMVPVNTKATLSLYVDGVLVKTQVYN
jgi:serine/threonine-protein kinase